MGNEIFVKNLEEDLACVIRYNVEGNVIFTQWFGFCDLYEAMNAADKLLLLQAKVKANSIICNKLEFEDYDEMAFEWKIKNFLPLLRERGIQNIALVLPNTEIIKPHLAQGIEIVNEIFNAKFFKNLDEAKQWIESLK